MGAANGWIVHACPLVPVAVPHASTLRPCQDALIEQGRQWLAEAAARSSGYRVRLGAPFTEVTARRG